MNLLDTKESDTCADFTKKAHKALCTFVIMLLSSCFEQLSLMATCTSDDTFVELIDQELNTWLTMMEHKYVDQHLTQCTRQEIS